MLLVCQGSLAGQPCATSNWSSSLLPDAPHVGCCTKAPKWRLVTKVLGRRRVARGPAGDATQLSCDAPANMPQERYVRASEIGTHEFCARALHLKDVGAPTTLGQAQQQGIAFHEAYGARVQSSTRTRKLSTSLIVAALVLLALAFLLAR